jgi:hypothetical protein
MGRYYFTTGPDTTGLNPGNLTSILDLTNLNVPYLEMYRLLVSTSVPAGFQVPAFVQYAGNTAQFTSGVTGSCTATFAKPVTKGNYVVAFASFFGTGTFTVSTVTSAGQPDNWTTNAALGHVNPNTMGGYTQVTDTITWTPAATTSSSNGLIFGVFEFSGLLNTSSPDQDSTGSASSAALNSGTTGATTQANEIWIGEGIQVVNTVADTIPTLTGPASPWINEAQQTNSIQNGGTGTANEFFFAQMLSYQVASAISTANWSASSNVSAIWEAAVFTMKSAPSGIPATTFTVAVDGKDWDQQTTVNGAGYTFDPPQPLVVFPGQNIQIFWPLSVTAYGPISNQIQVTAWFRYEPGIQPEGVSG